MGTASRLADRAITSWSRRRLRVWGPEFGWGLTSAGPPRTVPLLRFLSPSAILVHLCERRSHRRFSSSSASFGHIRTRGSQRQAVGPCGNGGEPNQ